MPSAHAIGSAVRSAGRGAMLRFGPALLCTLPVAIATGGTSVQAAPDCPAMNLPIERIGPPPTQYREFCAANARECDLAGPSVVGWTERTRRVVSHVNRTVNGQLHFVPDQEWQGQEELWSLPLRGCGDCEDFALEKRRRLAEAGLPRGAMTMAIVYHRSLWFSHALLLVETTAGTFALDSLSDEVRCWNDVPYDFETRERPDGQWTRFDQSYWKSR